MARSSSEQICCVCGVQILLQGDTELFQPCNTAITFLPCEEGPEQGKNLNILKEKGTQQDKYLLAIAVNIWYDERNNQFCAAALDSQQVNLKFT